MKKSLLTICIVITICSISFGQKLHTPAELIEIMEKSKVSYELVELKNEIKAPDRTTNLNYNTNYRVEKDNEIKTYKYKTSTKVDEYLNKAEQSFEARKFNDAREMYLKVIEVDSTYFQVMTYIGQIYGIEKDYDNAIKWYEKTIALNYIDYMAHWFLADIFRSTGEFKKALDEITIAHILNRNNPRIIESLKAIYNLNKLNYSEWVFNPQIQIDSTGVNKVRVSFNNDWLGYAMGKALWMYEPGYKEAMGRSNISYSSLQERECFGGLIVAFDKKKLKKYPEFKALQLALDRNMVDEYIIYEIFLLDHPFVAYQLSEDIINDIKNYVIQIRGKEM